ncbi:hypothetical protein [Flavivirga algicola]|uniref:Uncharacterized protein n=1 Tax=Flavivirga algicola TaxID=2729136 RepID=A0ABX1RXP4_9FLAO|nr:hypothetical protein [Flavivirga algicola]NMH88352.1 hypothetical protein [Flavivirga algicola]
MDIVKLIVKKLEYNLTSEEAVHFKNWLDESQINESMFYRLKILKTKGICFLEVIDLDTQYAWNQVKQKLK